MQSIRISSDKLIENKFTNNVLMFKFETLSNPGYPNPGHSGYDKLQYTLNITLQLAYMITSEYQIFSTHGVLSCIR